MSKKTVATNKLRLPLAGLALMAVTIAGQGCGHTVERDHTASVPARLAADNDLHTGSIEPAKRVNRNQSITGKRRFTGVVVDESDTIEGLALRYRIPVSTIAAANELKDGRIKPGQFLIIPL